jgi:hypothetical protein
MLLKAVYGIDAMVVGDNVVTSFVVALVSRFTLHDTVGDVDERDFTLAETKFRACCWQQVRPSMYRYRIALSLQDPNGNNIVPYL